MPTIEMSFEEAKNDEEATIMKRKILYFIDPCECIHQMVRIIEK